MKREVTLGEQPERFLETFESKLRKVGVFTEDEIQGAAAVLIAVIRGLENCRFHVNPHAVENDPSRLGYTIYDFADDEVEGRYSCNGDHIYLDRLCFSEAVLSGRIKRFAVRAA